MKTIRTAALALALAAGPLTAALAQGLNANIIPDKPAKTPEEIERDRAIERQYKETLKSIPDKKGSNDPWGAVRAADQGSAAKSVKPAAKKSAAAKTSSPARPQ